MKNKTIAKRVSTLVLCAALTTTSLAIAANAAQNTNVTAQLSPGISIMVDGKERTFYNVSGQEVHPITYNGTTYLPIRAIGELMGKNVNWDQSTLTVTLGGQRTGSVSGTPDHAATTQNITAQLRPDITIVVDGTNRTFADANGATVYPLLYDGSVYLPIRAIGNLMGKTVDWNGASSTVSLTGGNLVTDADSFNQTGGGQTSTGSISADRAKEIALDHAGLTASQVTFAWAKLDWDDGRLVYDVEFYTADYKEYDYEIDANTGAVLSFDYDAEYYSRPANTGNTSTGTTISEARAREIALAQVPGATASNVRKVKLDWDDGRAEYEVEIVYHNMEYDFDIDANTGTILSRDMESIWD